jgi:hypothetical protein
VLTGITSPEGLPVPSVKITRDFTSEDVSSNVREADAILVANLLRRRNRKLVLDSVLVSLLACSVVVVIAVVVRSTALRRV